MKFTYLASKDVDLIFLNTAQLYGYLWKGNNNYRKQIAFSY